MKMTPEQVKDLEAENQFIEKEIAEDTNSPAYHWGKIVEIKDTLKVQAQELQKLLDKGIY